MALLKSLKNIPYFLRLSAPYLQHGGSYLRFLRYISDLKRRGKSFGQVQGTNAVFTFDVRDLVIPSYMYTRKKTYSQEDIELFFRFAKEKRGIEPTEGIFLDIGANIGTTTVHVAKNMGPELQVISFEPDCLNFQLLSKNCEINGCRNVTLCNAALSDQSGIGEIQVFDYNRGKCQVIEDIDAEDTKQSKGIKTESVAMRSLDEYLSENNIPKDQIRYIWIDVEGHEARAINGMMELLSTVHPPILMEFTPREVPCIIVNDDDFVLLYKNLCRGYSRMILWPLNDPSHPEEHPIEYLEQLFWKGTQQYNLFLY